MHGNANRRLPGPGRSDAALHCRALRKGERQVNDIVEEAGIHQSGVSRHLRILHEAGFVSMRPDGQRRLYCLRPEPFRALDQWLASTAVCGKHALTAGAALEKRQSRRKPPNKEHDR